MPTINHVLVTGSSGTIGTRLCETLIEKGYSVIGVDYKTNRWNPKVDAITHHADLRDAKALEALPNDIDLVIHLAANARVYNLVADPTLAYDNKTTTFNVLEYVRKNKIPRYMFASSREVYGNATTDEPFRAEHTADFSHCESPYTASKIMGESMAWAYHRCYGLDMIIFRFSNVYGMYDASDRVMPLFIGKCLRNEDIRIYGKDKVLDFTYVDDTVSGIIRAIEQFAGAKNQVYNIATGRGVSMCEVAEKIQSALPNEGRIVIEENRPGEIMRYVADISRARSVLGYEPTTQIDEGIRKSIDWYQKYLYV